jgi:hypothetical protein
MASWRNFGTLNLSFSRVGAKPDNVHTYYSVGGETQNTIAPPFAEPYSKVHIILGAATLYFKPARFS